MDSDWLIDSYAQMLEDELNGAGSYPVAVNLPAAGDEGSTILWYYDEVGSDIILDGSQTPDGGPDDDSIYSFDDGAADSDFRAVVSFGAADDVTVYFNVSETGGVFTVVAGYVI